MSAICYTHGETGPAPGRQSITAVEEYLEFFEDSGAIRIKGHRIGLEHVLEQYKVGKFAEEVARYFPSLSLEKIYAALLYYFHHQEEMEQYLRDYEELGRRMQAEAEANPSPVSQRMRTLWREMREEKEKRRANEVSAL